VTTTPPNTAIPTCDVLGFAVHRLTKAQFLSQIEAYVAARIPSRHIVTLNVDILVQALANKALARILRRADLVVADGMPVVWYSRVIRQPVPERINGTDLVADLAELSSRRGYRLFFLGSSPESSLAAQSALKATYPNVVIAGSYQPPPDPWPEDEDERIAAAIREARPDILLVAFGTPKAETWVEQHAAGVPVSIGIGGALDILAGKFKRAPVWMQKNGLEWAYRLSQEPKRLGRRYLLRDARVFYDVARYWLRRLIKGSSR